MSISSVKIHKSFGGIYTLHSNYWQDNLYWQYDMLCTGIINKDTQDTSESSRNEICTDVIFIHLQNWSFIEQFWPYVSRCERERNVAALLIAPRMIKSSDVAKNSQAKHFFHTLFIFFFLPDSLQSSWKRKVKLTIMTNNVMTIGETKVGLTTFMYKEKIFIYWRFYTVTFNIVNEKPHHW